MKNEAFSQNQQTVPAPLPARITRPILREAHPGSHRSIRIVTLAAPRRPFCPAERKIRAAERAAELALWMASGGDYLSSEFIS